MADDTEKKPFLERLRVKFRHKYRLSIYRDETYEELLNLRLTRLNVMAILGVGIFVFLLLVISVIAYTPARELIPGYPDEKTVRNIRLNNFRLDSLELEIQKRDQYFENLRRIIRSSVEFGIKYLTIYAFSTENWGRPPEEVQGLMGILQDVIDRELGELHKEGVQLRHIGRLEG